MTFEQHCQPPHNPPFYNVCTQLAAAQTHNARLQHWHIQQIASVTSKLRESQVLTEYLEDRVRQLEELDPLEPKLHAVTQERDALAAQVSRLQDETSSLHKNLNEANRYAAILCAKIETLTHADEEARTDTKMPVATAQDAAHEVRLNKLRTANESLQEANSALHAKVDEATVALEQNIARTKVATKELQRLRRRATKAEAAAAKATAFAAENDEFVAALRASNTDLRIDNHSLSLVNEGLAKQIKASAADLENHKTFNTVVHNKLQAKKLQHEHFVFIVGSILNIFVNPTCQLSLDDAALTHRLIWTLHMLVTITTHTRPESQTVHIADRKIGADGEAIWAEDVAAAEADDTFETSGSYGLDLRSIKDQLLSLYCNGPSAALTVSKASGNLHNLARRLSARFEMMSKRKKQEAGGGAATSR
jgi:hypothetical protein